MPFNSIIFLFLFLPVVLFINLIIKGKLRNIVLMLFSIIFYAWAGTSFLIIILGSSIINYFSGKLIEKNCDKKYNKSFFIFSIIINVLLLCSFKYSYFITKNLNVIIPFLGVHTITLRKFTLPLGISFFTFQNIAYLIDVYIGKIKSERNYFIYAFSVIFFSKVIAGPIIRHQEISEQIRNRNVTIDDFLYGLRRFIIGLAKKVIIADILAVLTDAIFSLSPTSQSFLLCWIGIIAYTLQVYIDFSGYSDMAIGIARMLGFKFTENFNFPYMAKSLTEFWRRWHITLSSWLRDYIFTPLSLKYRYHGKVGLALALVITFSICGLWHGAGWTFIVWGLLHGIILAAESLWYGKKLAKSKFFGNIYLIAVIMITWVFFRAGSMYNALHFIKTLFTFSITKTDIFKCASLLNKEIIIIIIIALFGVFGIYNKIESYTKIILIKIPANVSTAITILFTFIEIAAMASVLIICSSYLATLSYNPFIYFRF